jgi:methyltransferase
MATHGWLMVLWTLLIGQRLLELGLARRNARLLIKQGAIEVAGEHYPLIVLMHVCFFVGLFLESVFFRAKPPVWWPVPFALFLGVQGVRWWIIASLGRFWNTRIFVIPGHKPRDKGPYRWIRHPNYAVVILELLLFPMVFGAYWTMGLVSLINAAVLFKIRIPAEEKAWLELSPYERDMGEKGRFLPVPAKR